MIVGTRIFRSTECSLQTYAEEHRAKRWDDVHERRHAEAEQHEDDGESEPEPEIARSRDHREARFVPTRIGARRSTHGERTVATPAVKMPTNETTTIPPRDDDASRR
jgi:hypothetical protein